MWRLLVGLFSIPVLLVETAFVVPPEASLTWWALVNILVYPLIVALCISLHEGGHALMARLVGLRVPRIDLGIGRRIAKWRWRKTVFTVNAFPMLGLTYLGADRSSGLRWRLWVTILAGPLTTALILAITLSVHGGRITDVLWPRHATVAGPAIAELIGFHTIWSLVINLLPLQIFGLAFRNDGTQLLSIPVEDAKKIQELTVLPAVLEAEELREADQFDAAYEVISRALQTAPDSRALRNSLALVHMSRERLHEARAVLLELIPDDRALETLVMRNNLAWIDFLINSDDLRTEADESSSLVQKRFKNVAFALGTRGAVLGWLGRHDEAIAMLQNAYARNSSPVNRALNACCLAFSLAAKGQVADAERWLAKGRSHHARCRLLARTEAAVTTARQAATTAPVMTTDAGVGES